MKKYIALIITVVILSLSLFVPAFASQKRVITLSDDYKYMYYSGNTYTRVDASMLHFTDRISTVAETYDVTTEDEYNGDALSLTDPFDYASYYTTKLTDEQQKEVKSVEIFNTNHDETLFFITIYFYDGSELSIDFIREDYVDEYNDLINGKSDNYTIDFRWPEGNAIQIDKEKLSIGNKVKFDVYNLSRDFSVYANSSTDSFQAEIGSILSYEDTYYYFSYTGTDIAGIYDLWDLEVDKIEVIELVDEELINQLKAGEEKYLDDEFGYLFDDELTEAVAKIFFIFVFALIPVAIFVVTLILALKSKKGIYKKLLLTTSTLSLVSLATFIYIAFTLFNK